MSETAAFINDRTIELITNDESFKMNVRQLAYDLKISKEDAKQDLLYDLLMNRLKENYTGPLTQDQQKMLTYAKKDIERKHFKAINEVLENEANTELVDIELIPEVQIALDYYELDNDQFNTMLMCFHSTQREFVSRVLLMGEVRAKEYYDMPTKVFNQKIKRVIKYVHDHKEVFRTRLYQNSRTDLLDTIDTINDFFRIYESPFISNEQITEAFLNNEDLLPFQSALDKVQYQGKLFDDWKHYTERTDFLLELNYQQQVLLDKVYSKVA